ncbi:hypothetical protein DFH11DRAFT_1243259 [Phellopilus nigrolimitatus]|nr:hypothetical protein DFH11DRAFT_1243259 [Phellopilus nigrolimitatus]
MQPDIRNHLYGAILARMVHFKHFKFLFSTDRAGIGDNRAERPRRVFSTKVEKKSKRPWLVRNLKGAHLGNELQIRFSVLTWEKTTAIHNIRCLTNSFWLPLLPFFARVLEPRDSVAAVGNPSAHFNITSLYTTLRVITRTLTQTMHIIRGLGLSQPQRTPTWHKMPAGSLRNAERKPTTPENGPSCHLLKRLRHRRKLLALHPCSDTGPDPQLRLLSRLVGPSL